MRKWLRVSPNLIGCIKGSAHRGRPFLCGEALRKALSFAYGASFWFRGLRGLDAFPAFGSAELNLGRVHRSFLSCFSRKWHKFAVVNDWIEDVERRAKSDLGLCRHASSKHPKSCYSTVHNRKSLPFFSIWGHVMHDAALATAIRCPESTQWRGPCGSVNVSGKFPQRGLATAITCSGSLREGTLVAVITSPEGPKARRRRSA